MAGLDGSGKSTQVDLLSQWLQDDQQDVVVYSFFKTNSKEKYRETINYLRKKNLNLNREQFLIVLASFQIKTFIENIANDVNNTNKVVIMDRFVETLYAHAELHKIDDNIIHDILDNVHIKPDFYFFIKLPYQTCYQRINERNERLALHETIESMEILAHSFEKLIGKLNMSVIDGNKNIQEIHKEIKRRLEWKKIRKSYKLATKQQ